MQARFNHTQIAKTAKQLGMTIIRWGLVLTLIGAGGMKFTAYEAMSIQSLVVHSPIVSCNRGLPLFRTLALNA